MIDTGITVGEKITPVIRRVTDKPLILILTLAHADHFYHIFEFDCVYMSHRELKMDETFLTEMMSGKDLNLRGTIDVGSDDRIDLGGECLEIFEAPGHTPGSIVILAEAENILFTGDAIGSGCGAWLQVPEALPLTDYYQSLRNLMKWLISKGGRMQFWGGHSAQRFMSMRIPEYNPLSIGLLADMIDLTDQIIRREIVGRPSNADKTFGLEPAKYAAYGRAELQYLESRIEPSRS